MSPAYATLAAASCPRFFLPCGRYPELWGSAAVRWARSPSSGRNPTTRQRGSVDSPFTEGLPVAQMAALSLHTGHGSCGGPQVPLLVVCAVLWLAGPRRELVSFLGT